jgi:hypothetical protein
MNRDETFAIINATLPVLDDAQATELAELAQALTQPTNALSLTDEDRAGIARGRQDFVEGRTHSSAEVRALTAEFLVKLRGTTPTA